MRTQPAYVGVVSEEASRDHSIFLGFQVENRVCRIQVAAKRRLQALYKTLITLEAKFAESVEDGGC